MAHIRIAYADCDDSQAWSLFTALDEAGHLCGLLPVAMNADHGYADAHEVASFTDIVIYCLSSKSKAFEDLLSLLERDGEYLESRKSIPIIAVSREPLSRPGWLPEAIEFIYISPVEWGDRGRYVKHLLAQYGIKSPALDRAYTRISNAGLQVFLSYAKHDRSAVRRLYTRLASQYINVWFDEEELLPGQNWEFEITQALRASDAVIACVSQNSVGRTGFVQREITIALDELEKRPEGEIFLLPARLGGCELPSRIRHLEAVDLYKKGGFARLVRALETIADIKLERWEGKP